MDFGYKRVSTIEQNTERQLDNIKCDRIFEDKLSGKNRNRPQLELLMSILRKGDVVHIHSMDRLARNTRDLLNLVQEMNDKGSTVVFHKENLTFNKDKKDPYQQLMMTMLGAVAELERSLILERQREGISIAKSKGKYKGGKNKLSAEQVAELIELSKTTSISRLAKQFGISRPTVYAYLGNNSKAFSSVKELIDDLDS